MKSTVIIAQTVSVNEIWDSIQTWNYSSHKNSNFLIKFNCCKNCNSKIEIKNRDTEDLQIYLHNKYTIDLLEFLSTLNVRLYLAILREFATVNVTCLQLHNLYFFHKGGAQWLSDASKQDFTRAFT